MKPVTLLHFITWMSAESLVSLISENGVGGQPLSLCDNETLDKRLPVRSLDAGREMSSKIPRIISIVWLIVVFQKERQQARIRMSKKKNICIRTFPCEGSSSETQQKVAQLQPYRPVCTMHQLSFFLLFLEFQEK